MRFQLLDEKRYPWPTKEVETKSVVSLPYYRYEHRATIGYNTREFAVFIDTVDNVFYIEEIIGGHLEKISDDEESLFDDLLDYVTGLGLVNVLPPIMKTSYERFI